MSTIQIRRAAGAAIVLLLHGSVIFLLLQSTWRKVPTALPHETTIWLSLPQSPLKSKPVNTPSTAPVAAAETPELAPALPKSHAITLPPMPEVNALQGLHGSLFDCAPENLANLSAEQRAHCRAAAGAPAPYDPNAVDYADHSGKIPGAQRWAREAARKNAPLLLPCASPAGIGVSIGTAICIGKGVLNGFDLEHKQEYFDKADDPRVPNNGDPQPLETVH